MVFEPLRFHMTKGVGKCRFAILSIAFRWLLECAQTVGSVGWCLHGKLDSSNSSSIIRPWWVWLEWGMNIARGEPTRWPMAFNHNFRNDSLSVPQLSSVKFSGARTLSGVHYMVISVISDSHVSSVSSVSFTSPLSLSLIHIRNHSLVFPSRSMKAEIFACCSAHTCIGTGFHGVHISGCEGWWWFRAARGVAAE